MTNVMVKTWIEQKIIKNSNPIQGNEEYRMSDSKCYPKADFSAVSELFIQQTTW